MYPQSKRDEYFDKAKKLAEAKAHKKALLKAKEATEQLMAAIPRQRTISDHSRFDALKQQLRQLEHGVRVEDGIPPGWEHLMGKPGLHDVEIVIVRLERECADLHAHIERWPTAETTRPYRYKGRGRKDAVNPLVFDGHELKPGDVVELTEGRAASLVNIFEAV